MSPIISAAAVEAVRPGLRIAFSCARRPATPPSRAAGRPTTWASGRDESRRDHGEADEDAEGAAGDAEDAHRGRNVRAECPVDEPEDRQRRHDEAEAEHLPRLLLHDHAAFANSCDRSDPRRPHGRPHRGDQRDERARQDRDDGRPRTEDGGGLRQLELDSPEEGGQPLREQDAEAEADGGGDEAEHRAFEHDRAEHLAARGAERPQGRELLRPLCDRDRERVEDDERADEERDPAEGEQEVADEGDELADAFTVRLRLLGAGLHLGRVGQRH